jgi:hypothetical protein
MNFQLIHLPKGASRTQATLRINHENAEGGFARALSGLRGRRLTGKHRRKPLVVRLGVIT